MTKTQTIHYTLCGLEYVYLIDAPIGIADGEEFIDLPPEQIDRQIAAAIVREGVPLRGKEVLFLRKALGMNRNQWAKKLGVTASGILRWEQAGDKLLSKINAVAIRLLCAEELGVALAGTWSAVAGENEQPERLEVAA